MGFRCATDSIYAILERTNPFQEAFGKARCSSRLATYFCITTLFFLQILHCLTDTRKQLCSKPTLIPTRVLGGKVEPEVFQIKNKNVNFQILFRSIAIAIDSLGIIIRT